MDPTYRVDAVPQKRIAEEIQIEGGNIASCLLTNDMRTGNVHVVTDEHCGEYGEKRMKIIDKERR